MVSIVAYQDYQDQCTKEEIRFSHVGLSAHAHNIVQEVEVHEWLLLALKHLTVEQLQLEHTHSLLYHIPRAATPRGIMNIEQYTLYISNHISKSENTQLLQSYVLS